MTATPSPPEPGLLAITWTRLLRFGFRLLYNEMAFTYDSVSRIVSLNQWRDWQRVALAHLDLDPGARVLELAHGTGNFQIDLRDAGFHPAAVDLSPHMGRIAIRKLRRWGIQPSLARARAQSLPFATARFPAVVSTFPTEFIVAPDTLREVFRVLEPDGRLVVITSGLLTRGTTADRALELAYRATGQRGPWPVDVDQYLAAAGFTATSLQVELPHSVVLGFVAHKPA